MLNTTLMLNTTELPFTIICSSSNFYNNMNMSVDPTNNQHSLKTILMINLLQSPQSPLAPSFLTFMLTEQHGIRL